MTTARAVRKSTKKLNKLKVLVSSPAQPSTADLPICVERIREDERPQRSWENAFSIAQSSTDDVVHFAKKEMIKPHNEMKSNAEEKDAEPANEKEDDEDLDIAEIGGFCQPAALASFMKPWRTGVDHRTKLKGTLN